MAAKRVAILGASNNEQRYSYKALKMLQEYGHVPLLVSPSYETIESLPVHKKLSELSDVDVLTVYVGPKVSDKLTDEIIKLKPKRVIFNPGSENDHLMKKLMAENIPVEQACTLVLLRTGQF